MAFLKIASIETLYFDRIYALHGLPWKSRKREIFAVLGPNGAGKTTLLKTIAGLLKDQPKKGTIEFGGRRFSDSRRSEKSSPGDSIRSGRPGPISGVTVGRKPGTWLLGPARQGKSRTDMEYYLRSFSHPEGEDPAAGGDPVRRRAADAGHRAGHPAPPQTADAG